MASNKKQVQAKQVGTKGPRASEEEDFGLIRPTLIKQLRSILDQYPDDGQILKELLQNAEDAKATEVRFLYDEQQHPADPNLLYHPGLAQYQGAALYAYNNGIFEEKDWRGIRMLQDSVKESEPMKVGRFGLGFKSVLHMTDLPCVLSGGRLAIIDPHEKFFKFQDQNTTGYSWILASRRADLAKIPHQIRPFIDIFGSSTETFQKGHFPGTIFRFPLRKTPSQLSDTIYEGDKMKRLFDSFETDAHLVLLFLKSVEKVQLYTHRVGEKSPTLLFKVQVMEDCRKTVRQYRQQFIDNIEPNSWMSQPINTTYPLNIETVKYNADGSSSHHVFKYLVSEHYGGGNASIQLKQLHADPVLSNIPLVGVAMPLDVPPPPPPKEPGQEGEESKEETDSQPAGHVFCFLPLPIEQRSSTGLPAHINGYFSISQNRRHLKWPTAGQNVKGDKSLLWNQCLLKELVPQAYVNMLLKAIELSRTSNGKAVSPDDIYAAMPNIVEVDEKWQLVLPLLYEKLFMRPVFYSLCGHNTWVDIETAMFDFMRETKDTANIVKSVLISGGIHVVNSPRYLLHAMGAFSSYSPEIISPSLVRNVLRCKSDILHSISRTDKVHLLSYVLKDQDFIDLLNIPLLPLADGTFVKFTKPPGGRVVYLPSDDHPGSLLPGLEGLLAATDVDDSIRNKLSKLAGEGCTQLQSLNKNHVLKLLARAIPAEWMQKDVIHLTPGTHDQHIKWLHQVWDYLRCNFPSDISTLTGLPLLAVQAKDGAVEVYRLALPSQVMLASAMGCEVSEGARRALQVMGVFVVDELCQTVSGHAAVIGNYVRIPLPEDVLDAAALAYKSKGSDVSTEFKKQTTDSDKSELREMFSKIMSRHIQSHHLKLLQQLPIFEVKRDPDVAGEEPSEVEYVSLAEVGKAAPLNMPLFRSSGRLLDLSNEDARRLAHNLGVVPMTQSELLRQHMFADMEQGQLDSDEIESIINYVIDNLPLLQKEDPGFVNHLRKVPFVVSSNKQFVTPQQVYDPECAFVEKFFYEEEVFPMGKYAESQYLMFLRQLGLKDGNNISASEVWKSVQKLVALTSEPNVEQGSLLAKSQAIMQHLGEHSRQLHDTVNQKKLHQLLADAPWVATLQDQPNLYPDSMPWFKSQMFVKPNAVHTLEWFALIGSVSAVAIDMPSIELASVFGWDKPPPVCSVLKHFAGVIEHYDAKKKAKFLALITSIYDYLSTCNAAEVFDSLQRYGPETWIWHGDGFTSARHLTIRKPPLDLKPYLYSLPMEISLYQSLFTACGVPAVCSDELLVHVLQRICSKHSETTVDDITRDLQLAIDILNLLKTKVNQMDSAIKGQILVPLQTETNTEISMRPIMDCTYCDIEWLQQGFHPLSFDEKDGIYFIHSDVPVPTAEALGVPTLMSRMLHAEELSVTGFGQAEPLTSRLNRLLEDYTDGYAIPKEVVQNADDAGATVVKFLYDERTNEDAMQFLIDEGMRECHGPALWAYNNAVFTDTDFENITKLGGATKEMEPDKIGKFGLGFNAVYNITDVPSFISRNYIVIFDPHTTHVGRGIKDRSKPGIRIDMEKNRTLIRKLPDQFKPYQNVFGCKIDAQGNNQNNGTLFRFPLRNKHQAEKSEISSLHYDREEMVKLLQMFAKGAQNLLLFTQNVIKIELYHLAADQSDPADAVRVLSVHKQLAQNSFNQLYGNDSLGKLAFLKSGTEYVEHARANQGLFGRIKMELPRVSAVISVGMELTVEGEKLLEEKPQTSEQHWFISTTLGIHKALTMSVKMVEDGLVPVASVAAPLELVEDQLVLRPLTDIGMKGQLFCFLPLPIHTGLPVHINGSFAVHSNRRYLCERTEDDKYNRKSEWNEALLEDAVYRAYEQMLTDVETLCNRIPCEYTPLWPCIADAIPTIHPLVHRFYTELTRHRHLPTHYDGVNQISIESVVLLDPTLSQHSEIGGLALQAFRQCQTSGVVIEFPPSILQSFTDTGHGEFLASKTFSQKKFFDDVFFTNIAALEANTRDTLLVYVLDQMEPELEYFVKITPCIPVTPDGQQLKRPFDLAHPLLMAAKLYHPEEGVFPCGADYLTPARLNTLQMLGMRGNDLGWSDIIERAHSVKPLMAVDQGRALVRIKNLWDFIDRGVTAERVARAKKQPGADLQNIANELRQIECIPVLGMPKGFPLPWKSESEQGKLLSGEELHLAEHKYLISTSQYMADEEGMTNQVKVILGLKSKQVTIESVLAQFEHALAVDPKELDKNSYNELSLTNSAIYDYLQNECLKDPDLEDVLTNTFKHRKCILSGFMYIAPTQTAFELVSDCAPYLYRLPSEYSHKYMHFMKVVGVRQKFTVEDYHFALGSLSTEMRSTMLKGPKLDLSLRLVSQLNTAMTAANVTAEEIEEKHGPIFIPNAQGVLQPSTALCFNDCPWLESTHTMNFTHGGITFNTSSKLGVKTKRQEALSKYAQGIPFGQKERLTNSLKRILSNYPCDHEIFKELIQNADDAHASEIHFVVDARQHSTEHVFENSWKQLQGPGLCVYNNAPFSLADLEGIQRLGEGSKTMDPNKTGQYGIGFSSVYHLTDAPSLMTASEELGETLCIFDPQCCYVPGASQAEPGMRYSDLKILKQTFPDVFSCYLQDIFELKNRTLFRFPLRSQSMAHGSTISKTYISVKMLFELLGKLKKEAFEILLFTSHIRQISISDVNPHTGQLQNTYTLKADLRPEDLTVREIFYGYARNVTKQLKEGEVSIDKIAVKDVNYSVNMSDTEGRQESWKVTQRLGVDDDAVVPEAVRHAFAVGDLCLLPKGGTACLLEKRIHGNMVSDNRQRRVFCFLPLPLETTLPVHINGHFALGHENRRHLWTDCSSYKHDWNVFLCTEVIAPIYVHLLMSIRMLGLNSTITNDVAQVYCNRSMLDSAIQAYQEYFPSFDEQRPQWNDLVKAVYKCASTSNSPLLPAIREDRTVGHSDVNAVATTWQVTWLPPCGTGSSKAFFSQLEKAEAAQEQTSFFGRFKGLWRSVSAPVEKSESQILKETLLDCGFKILEATSMVIQNFEKAEVEIHFMAPAGVNLFFQSYSSAEPMCDIGQLPLPLLKTPLKTERNLKIVLKYCKEDPDFLDKLPGMPLLLTCDGMLRVFDPDNPVFLSEYQDLLPECSENFLHKTLREDIFKTASPQSCPAFKDFQMDTFAVMLPKHLGQERFRKSSEPTVWMRGFNAVPSEAWVKKMWTFARKQVPPVEKKASPDSPDERVGDPSRADEIKSILAPLNDWCLIPARSAGQHYLYPLGRGEDVLDLRHVEFIDYGVRDVLHKLRLPELEASVINVESTENADFARQLVTSLDKPVAVLKALSKSYENSAQVSLGKLECGKVLKYFTEKVDKLREDESSVQQLRKLPFYTTIHGDLICLTDCLVYTLPAQIPTDDIDIWQSKSGTVFLERYESLQPLYDYLQCASISVLEVYCKFILQHFEYISSEARMVHLYHIYQQYIKNDQLPEEEMDQLLTCLRELQFIEDKNGELHDASEFYDPENLLFRVMIPEENLPPRAGGRFRESEWLVLLRKLGMKSVVTKDMCLEFAQRIAALGKDPDNPAAISKSKVMVEHIFKLEPHNRQEVLQGVASVPFIAPQSVSEERQKLFSQYGDFGDNKLPFICLKESFSQEYENLVWTTSSILPDFADPSKLHRLPPSERTDIMECLEMHKRPPVEYVVRHLKTLSEHHVNNPQCFSDKRMRRDIFGPIYRYLEKHIDEDLAAREDLKEIPCVAVNGDLAFTEPAHTVLNIYDGDQIQPYLYKVPAEFGEFQNLFVSLGTCEVPSVDQYASVLERLAVETGGDRLHPNELRTAYKAVNGLFTRLEKTNQRDIKCMNLYLPNEDGRLMDATRLVFNDTPAFYDRVGGCGIHFLCDLKECGIRYRVFEDLLENLPSRIHPGMLSAYVKETLVKRSKASITKQGIAAVIGGRLRSEAFLAAVARLVRHECHKSGRKLEEKSMYNILDRLSTIHVYGAGRLLTHLVYRDKPIAGSEMEKTCFVERVASAGPDHWNVYIKDDAKLTQDLLIPLAEVVNCILAGVLRDSVLFLLPILACPEDEIVGKLDMMNVRMDHTQNTTKMPILPQPGASIPDEHSKWVARLPGGTFHPEEYIAYRDDEDSGFQYATVIEKLADTTFEDTNVDYYFVNLGPPRENHIISSELMYRLARSSNIPL